jgi:hypothetical protein
MAELSEQELNSCDWACFCLGEEKANNTKTSSPWLINIPKMIHHIETIKSSARPMFPLQLQLQLQLQSQLSSGLFELHDEME